MAAALPITGVGSDRNKARVAAGYGVRDDDFRPRHDFDRVASE
jgi:hypothetical protein